MDYVKNREEVRAPYWQRLEERIGGAEGREIVEAMKELYSIYNDDIIDWFSGLYDARTGGYYYSESARDNEGFLPDAESTHQALNFWESSGMSNECGGSYLNAIPDFIKEAVPKFIYGLQDPDGYFYHPQWGKDIIPRRRGRDLSWCVSLLKKFGVEPRYSTILDSREDSGDGQKLIPDHLKDRESFLAYLSTLDIAGRSYHVGSDLSSQFGQITALGLRDDCISYLNEKQNPESGIWQDKKNYYGINGLMKISCCYTAANIILPNSLAAARSAIEAITSDEPMGAVVDLYNTWYAVGNILVCLRSVGGEEGAAMADQIVGELMKIAPAAIRKSKEKIAPFRKPDGGYSYGPNYSSATSQSVPAAVPKSAEGDVNGTVIAVMGIINHIYRALELTDVKVPLFVEADRQRYCELLESKRNDK